MHSPYSIFTNITTDSVARRALALALLASSILCIAATKPAAAQANDFVITAPMNNQRVSNKVRLSAIMTRKLRKETWSLEFWVDSVRVGVDRKAPFNKVVDTRRFSNGQHVFRVSLLVKKAGGAGPDKQVCQYLRTIYLNIKNKHSSASASALAKTSNIAVPTPIASKKKTWKLAFDDEFNGTALDRTKWNDQRDDWITGGTPYNNREGAWYKPENNTFSKGSLVQTIRQETAGDMVYSSHLFNNTTGMLNSNNKFSFQYGYVEARVNVPSCQGCWPVFWTLPIGNVWPPEVDIFEYIDTAAITRRPFLASHWQGADGSEQSDIRYYTEPCGTATDYTRNFHTYALLWTPTSIQPFLDGVPGPRVTGAAVPHVAMYLILQLSTSILDVDRVVDGPKMLTDYIRVWQAG